eukprot:12919844-Prorocentrum_lima.AAC.1
MVNPKTIVGDQYVAEPKIQQSYTFHGMRIGTHDTLAEPCRSSSGVVQASRIERHLKDVTVGEMIRQAAW